MNSVRKCWDFGTNESPHIPQIQLLITSINFKKYSSHFFKIDTGFSGTLGITPEIVNLLSLEPRGLMTIRTAIGTKEIPYFSLIVKCEEINLKESLLFAIETPRTVCGRSFLKNRKWLLDFKNSKFCYYKD